MSMIFLYFVSSVVWILPLLSIHGFLIFFHELFALHTSSTMYIIVSVVH
jgi:hypothetical protein